MQLYHNANAFQVTLTVICLFVTYMRVCVYVSVPASVLLKVR